jgi:hypothetical protein
MCGEGVLGKKKTRGRWGFGGKLHSDRIFGYIIHVLS